VFTARYALSPYIKQIRFVFKGLITINTLIATGSAFIEPPLIHVQFEVPHFISAATNRFFRASFKVDASFLFSSETTAASSADLRTFL
jgi:hypothetical protein